MRRVALCAMLLTACGAPGSQIMAAGSGSASGNVTLDDKPVAGLTLSLVGPGGGARVTTGADGRWTASDLEPGDYTFYYLGSKQDEVAYWQGPKLHLDAGGAISFPAIDVGHHGVPQSPAPDKRVNLPGTFGWSPYPGATNYGFEVLDGTGPKAKVLFRPTEHFSSKVTNIVYDGGVNTRDVPHTDGLDYLGKPDQFLIPGKYAWSVVWDTKDAGEGHGPARAFEVVKLQPRMFPKTMDQPD